MFMEERKATGMDNNYSMVRLRQLGMAFLLAIVIIGLFAYMGMRGSRRNEILNEQFIGAFNACRELLLTLNHVEFQITMVSIEYKNSGLVAEASLERCRKLVALIDDRFENLANAAEAHLSVYAQYYEFLPLMHQLGLQVAVLELEALQTVADLIEIVTELNNTLEQIMSEKAESESHLQSVSLGLIAAITLLVIAFSLPLMFLPVKQRSQRSASATSKRSKKSRRDNVYQFPKNAQSHRKKTPFGK
jgi:cysteinyl-tRNA synthetase